MPLPAELPKVKADLSKIGKLVDEQEFLKALTKKEKDYICSRFRSGVKSSHGSLYDVPMANKLAACAHSVGIFVLSSFTAPTDPTYKIIRLLPSKQFIPGAIFDGDVGILPRSTDIAFSIGCTMSKRVTEIVVGLYMPDTNSLLFSDITHYPDGVTALLEAIAHLDKLGYTKSVQEIKDKVKVVDVKIGADPEMLIVDAEGSSIPAGNLFGQAGRIGTDGRSDTMEIRPVASDSPDMVVEDVRRIFREFKDLYPNMTLSFNEILRNAPLGGHLHIGVIGQAEKQALLDNGLHRALFNIFAHGAAKYEGSVRGGSVYTCARRANDHYRQQPHGMEVRFYPAAILKSPKVFGVFVRTLHKAVKMYYSEGLPILPDNMPYADRKAAVKEVLALTDEEIDILYPEAKTMSDRFLFNWVDDNLAVPSLFPVTFSRDRWVCKRNMRLTKKVHLFGLGRARGQRVAFVGADLVGLSSAFQRANYYMLEREQEWESNWIGVGYNTRQDEAELNAVFDILSLLGGEACAE